MSRAEAARRLGAFLAECRGSTVPELHRACPLRRPDRLLLASPEPWMPDELFEQTVFAFAEYGSFDVVHVCAFETTAEIVDGIHKKGMVAHANAAHGPADHERAIAAGADRVRNSRYPLELTTTLVRPWHKHALSPSRGGIF